jgi:hypothetical protein
MTCADGCSDNAVLVLTYRALLTYDYNPKQIRIKNLQPHTDLSMVPVDRAGGIKLLFN